VKLGFFERSVSDRNTIIAETAARRGASAVIVEKDFWVSWMLAVLFSHPQFGQELVFKGGTSLSKVFGVIGRFSEDIDLSVSPQALGIDEADVERAPSRSQRTARMQQLENGCIRYVRERVTPELERIARISLGQRTDDGNWMEFLVDGATQSPVVLFHYPCSQTRGFDYLTRSVKMEFGSLTDQRPVNQQTVQPWIAEEFPEQLADFRCELVVLDLERSFWEKATILHAEYHRDQNRPIRDRFSRHYSDVAALAGHEVVEVALANQELRDRVADWKSRFFSASWAHYELAKPGSFRLSPPEFRLHELEQDYRAMEPMFLAIPPPFREVIRAVSDLEHRINEEVIS
jgi:hypothetical protein